MAKKSKKVKRRPELLIVLAFAAFVALALYPLSKSTQNSIQKSREAKTVETYDDCVAAGGDATKYINPPMCELDGEIYRDE